MPGSADLGRLVATIAADISNLRRSMDDSVRIVQDGVSRMNAQLGQVQQSTRGIEQAFVTMGRGVSTTWSSIVDVTKIAVGVNLATTLSSFVSSIRTATAGMQALEVNFTNFFGKTTGAQFFAQSILLADQYGKSIQSVAGDVKKLSLSFSMEGGAPGAGLNVYTNLLQAGKQLRLSQEEISGITETLARSLEREDLTASRLIRTFSEYPGAVKAIKETMSDMGYTVNGTTQEFNKLQVKITPSFVEDFSKRWKDSTVGAGESTKTLAGEMQKLSNAWTEFLNALGSSGAIGAVIGAVDLLTATVKTLESALKGVGSAFASAAEKGLIVGEYPVVEQPSQISIGKPMSLTSAQQAELAKEIEAARRYGADAAIVAALAYNESSLAQNMGPVTDKRGTLHYGTGQFSLATARSVPGFSNVTAEQLMSPDVGRNILAARVAQFQRMQYEPENIFSLHYSGRAGPINQDVRDYVARGMGLASSLSGNIASMGASPRGVGFDLSGTGGWKEDTANAIKGIADAQKAVNEEFTRFQAPADAEIEKFKSVAEVAGTQGISFRKSLEEYTKLREGIQKNVEQIKKGVTEGNIKTMEDIKGPLEQPLKAMQTVVEKLRTEYERLTGEASRVAESTRPVDQAFRKLEDTVKSLNIALRSGEITQDIFNQRYKEAVDLYSKSVDYIGDITSAIQKENAAVITRLASNSEDLQKRILLEKAVIAEKQGHFDLAQSLRDEAVERQKNKELIQLEAKAQDTYARAIEEAQKRYGTKNLSAEVIADIRKQTDATTASQKEQLKGNYALEDELRNLQKQESSMTDTWIVQFRSAAQQMEGAFSSFFVNAMEGHFENLGDSFKSMIDQMVAKLLASQLMNFLFGESFMSGKGNLGGLLGSGIGSFFGTKHTGGMGYEGPMHYMHSGWTSPDEIPTIIKRDEGVFTQGQMRALGLMANSGNNKAQPNIIMNINTPDVASFKASQRQLIAQATKTLARNTRQ